MRYLHNSPNLPFHGHLTSHNCLVDSRWVLKITDYGQHLFRQAQGLEPICRTKVKGQSLPFIIGRNYLLPVRDRFDVDGTGMVAFGGTRKPTW